MTDNKKNEALLKNSITTLEIIKEIPDAMKILWKFPIVKTVVYIGFGIAAHYTSRLTLDQVSAGIRSANNFKNACKNQKILTDDALPGN